MKLMWSPASPYVRKVLVTAHELGVADSLELVPMRTAGNVELQRHNPIGKIPTLLLENNIALYDSQVICEYLNARFGQGRLLPPGDDLWLSLRRLSLADGILDAGLLARAELRRSPDRQLDEQLKIQLDKARRGMNWLETDVETFGDRFGAAEIAVACAVGWLEFRFAAEGWLDERPNLRRWTARVEQRDSMQATIPKEWVQH